MKSIGFVFLLNWLLIMPAHSQSFFDKLKNKLEESINANTNNSIKKDSVINIDQKNTEQADQNEQKNSNTRYGIKGYNLNMTVDQFFAYISKNWNTAEKLAYTNNRSKYFEDKACRHLNVGISADYKILNCPGVEDTLFGENIELDITFFNDKLFNIKTSIRGTDIANESTKEFARLTLDGLKNKYGNFNKISYVTREDSNYAATSSNTYDELEKICIKYYKSINASPKYDCGNIVAKGDKINLRNYYKKYQAGIAEDILSATDLKLNVKPELSSSCKTKCKDDSEVEIVNAQWNFPDKQDGLISFAYARNKISDLHFIVMLSIENKLIIDEIRKLQNENETKSRERNDQQKSIKSKDF